MFASLVHSIMKACIRLAAASLVLVALMTPAQAQSPQKPAYSPTQSGAVTPAQNKPKSDSRGEARLRRQQLAAVRSWAIQLRFLDPATVANSALDLIVMDHAPHPKPGNEAEAVYSVTDIAPMQRKPDGNRRLVLAYLSIAEAERYRYYWQPSWDTDPAMRPSWLRGENPNWAGNYYVKYEDPDWQAIIFGTPASYLDRIIAAGFDGVYLDRVDAFQDEGQPPEAEEAMVRFVSRICDHARRTQPKFLVIMQNAEELVRYSTLRQRLDGVAKEDLAYGSDNTVSANPPEMVKDTLQNLRKARKAGLTVLTIEYVKDTSSIAAVRMLNERENFRLYIADRLLDSLKTQDDVSVPAAGPPDGTQP